jgi:excisionase family DNA binding protein
VAIVSGTPPKPEVRMAALLSVEEVAAELGTPVRFVRRLIHERRIRFHKIGKYVRISRSDLEAFIAAGAIPPFRS